VKCTREACGFGFHRSDYSWSFFLWSAPPPGPGRRESNDKSVVHFPTTLALAQRNVFARKMMFEPGQATRRARESAARAMRINQQLLEPGDIAAPHLSTLPPAVPAPCPAPPLTGTRGLQTIGARPLLRLQVRLATAGGG
jgi:hypothetical protein